MLYVYSDQQSSMLKVDQGEVESITSVSLLTDKEITQSLIDEALDNLKNDHTVSDGEKEAVRRGYFVPSQDSEPARQYLAFAIKQSLKCLMDFSYAEHDMEEGTPLGGFRRSFANFEKSDLLTYFSKSPIVKVFLRNPTPTCINSVLLWQETLHNRLFEMSRTHYPKKVYYPRIELCEALPAAARQVLDFLVWYRLCEQNTQNRFKSKEWLNIVFDQVFTDGQYITSRYKINTIPFLYDDNYPVKPPTFLYDKEIFAGWLRIELFFGFFDPELLPAQASHFKQRFSEIRDVIIKNQQEITLPFLADMSRCYLALFDLIPIYNHLPLVVDPENVLDTGNVRWADLLMGKRVAAYFWQHEDPDSGIYQTKYIQWRQLNISKNRGSWDGFMQSLKNGFFGWTAYCPLCL